MKLIPIAVAIALLLSACDPTASIDEKSVMSAEASATAKAAAPIPESVKPSVEGADESAASSSKSDAEKEVSDAIDSNLGDHLRYRAVIEDLQKAVAAGDAGAVAALAQFPISVEIDGKRTSIGNARMFAEHYADFMTPDIREAIITTEYKDLFVNYKGVMFGNGQAWVNGICKDNECKSFDVKLVTLQSGPK